MWPVDSFDRLGAWLERQLLRVTKEGHCRYADGKIVRHRGLFTCDEIHVDDIVEWSVVPEMGFDVVTISLRNGTPVRWLDTDDSLLGTLRRHAASQMREC
jgi:hypothetical protein